MSTSPIEVGMYVVEGAAGSASPHEWFEFQTLLGYLAAKFPGMRLGVGVTEPSRRHPAILAQALRQPAVAAAAD